MIFMGVNKISYFYKSLKPNHLSHEKNKIRVYLA